MTDRVDARRILEALACSDPRCECQRSLRRGQGKTHCPCHDDRRPSLSISVARDGTILLKCHAGCQNRDVVRALQDRDLWPHREHQERTTARETRYELREPGGALVAVHVRLDGPDGKRMWWESPDGHKGLGGLRVEELPLYGVEKLGDAPEVLIVEGEKAADALIRLGLSAVGTVCGASVTPSDDVLRSLLGRKVYLWPDNDEPGRAHMERIAERLRALGCNDIRVVEWPDAPPHGDAADFVARGATTDDVRRLLDAAQPHALLGQRGGATGTPRPITASELLALELPAPRWVVPGLLCEGVTLLVGRPKLGKSWLVLDLAVAVASGGIALGTYRCPAASDALYLALEDSPRRLRSRLLLITEGAQTRLDRLHLETRWPPLDSGGLEALLDWLEQHPDCRLVIIDTLKRIRPRQPGLRRTLYDLDYEALQPLADLAQTRGISIVVVHHTRKSDAEDPLDLVSGTTGLTGAADAVWVLKRARGEADGTLALVGRDHEDRELALRFDAARGCWYVVGDAADAQLSQERREILELLERSKPLYPREVAETLGLSRKAAWKRLQGLVDAGLVTVDERGRYMCGRRGRRVDAEPENRDTTPKVASTTRLPEPVDAVDVDSSTVSTASTASTTSTTSTMTLTPTMTTTLSLLAWAERLLKAFAGGSCVLPPVELDPGQRVVDHQRFLQVTLVDAQAGDPTAVERLVRYRDALEPFLSDQCEATAR